jgi:XTP/dITP diphosphohydrolase
LTETRPELLLATGNRGKVREYRSLLRGIPYKIVTPADLGMTLEVAETGDTFAENAGLKAAAFAAAGRRLALADDSGLEVDALGGGPGPLSRRYAGKGASDAERVVFLLARLRDVPEEARTARFRCVIAIAGPGGRAELCEGECRGVIITVPRGSHGFGYDPVFYLPEMGRTMAELTLAEKNRVSHRARAAAKAREKLREIYRRGGL